VIRYAWISLMVLLALLAGGAQLDRQARRDPALAPLVPTPFRSFALERLTIATVRVAEPADAIRTARLLVERRPVPSEHLSLLAIAEARNGNTADAAILVQRAAQRGWRDSIAQRAMLNIAFNAGDLTEAAHRLAALWAMREDQELLVSTTNQLLKTPAGRAAMADALATNGRWAKAFVSAGAELQAGNFAETIALSATKGARLNCGILQRIEAAYGRQKLDREMALIASARQNCAR